ncbi:MAG TPA: hypothetical protein VNN74_06875 [Candidatus Micrarchaeia archaeon]|nr:hypothetical protein [Candidatus Micrarchaeia archaeon]
MRRRIPRAAAVLPLGLALVACAGGSRGSGGDPTSSAPLIWIAPRNVVGAIRSDAYVRHQLRDGQLIEIVLPGQRPVPNVPAEAALSLKSLPDIRAAFAGGLISRWIQAVIYDNEDWPATPYQERLRPIHFERKVARLVARHHLMFISSPALDLARELPSTAGSLWRRYLHTGWMRGTARLAVVVEVPAQSYENHPPVYARFVRAAAIQARSANPDVKVIAGLTSTRGAPSSLTADLTRCVRLTAGDVQGYFLNVPQPPLAAAVLRAATRSPATAAPR